MRVAEDVRGALASTSQSLRNTPCISLVVVRGEVGAKEVSQDPNHAEVCLFVEGLSASPEVL